MQMEAVSVRMNKEEIEKIATLLKEKRSEIVRTLLNGGKKMLAIELYKEKKVSLGLASRLAGLSLSEFIDLLKEFNITLNLEKEDVKQALRYAKELL